MSANPVTEHGDGITLSLHGRNAVLNTFRTAVAEDLQMLAVLHDAEPDQTLIHSLKASGFPAGLGLKLQSELGREALDVLSKALEALSDPVDPRSLDQLAVDYADIYLTHGLQASPNESVWIDDENLERQRPMFQVREHYRQHGLMAPQWRVRADDHLVMQLQFLAHLFDPNQSGNLAEAARFMDEHLLRWLVKFAQRVAGGCATPFFAGAAMLTGAYCEQLRELLVKVLGEPRPSQKEIDARMRPKQQVQAVPLKYMPGHGPGW